MSYLLKAITVGIIVAVSGLLFSLTPPGLKLEEISGLPLMYKLRGPRQVPNKLIVVSIDKLSASRLNVDEDPKKWPRSLHAKLTEILASRGASVIAFDLFFNESRSREDDRLFAQAISSTGNVVLNEYVRREVLFNNRGEIIDQLHAEKHISPISSLADPAAAVVSFPLPKVPHRVNQYWTFKTASGDIPTLPLAAFQIFALEALEDFIRRINMYLPEHREKLSLNRELTGNSGNIIHIMKTLRHTFYKNPSLAGKMLDGLHDLNVQLSDPRENTLIKSLIKMYQSPNSHYLNFYGPPRSIPTIPYHEVLQLKGEPSAEGNEPDFSGKAVFVGVSENTPSEKKNDGFITLYSQPNGVDISGVEIAATAFLNLIEGMPVKPLNAYGSFAVIFSWGFFMGIIFVRLFPSVLSLKEMVLPVSLAFAAGIVYLMIALYFFKTGGIWSPLVIPLFQIPAAFFFSLLIRNIHGERTGYGIYLFTDISGFTKISEDMDPQYLKELMNEYFEPLSRIVEKHGGVTESVPGDAMLARWEVKDSGEPSKRHRMKSCLAALDISEQIANFIQFSDKQLHTRIGLHCGFTSRGIIGSRQQRKSITYGDPVNTAQRVEELNKCLGTQILMSESVIKQLDGLLARNVGKFVLAGKTKPLVLYELICSIDKATVDENKLCSSFSEGLQAFEIRAWEEAAEKFNHIINTFGHDGPSRYYLGLCEKFRQKPPEQSWSGVVCMEKT